MRRLWFLLGLLAIASLAFAQAPTIKVMTQNLYLGTDLKSLTSVRTFNQLLDGVGAQFAQVQATDFPARAQVIAAEIAQQQPDLIGLQECAIWSTGPVNGQPAQYVQYDFLQLLLDALQDWGQTYEVLAVSYGSDVQLPGRIDNTLVSVRLQDRDVVLGRVRNGLTFNRAYGANFRSFRIMPILGQPFQVKQGYCVVDASAYNKNFRFISTHLDPELALDNVLQMQELLRGPANTRMNVILVGDLNSPAAGNSPFVAYQLARAACFRDGWNDATQNAPGNTFGHASDLRDDPSLTFFERIDYTLYRGNFTPFNAVLFGLDPNQRTATDPPLWPSDHAGVITTFLVQ